MSARRRRTRPAWLPWLTLRGGVFLLAGSTLAVVGLVLGRRDLLFVAVLLLLLPLLALVFVSVRPVRVHVGRAVFPAVVAAGDSALISLRIRNLSPRPVFGARWRDTVSGSIRPPERRDLPTLDRGGSGPDGGPDSARVDYPVLPPSRGLYTSGPLQLGRSDPFGLAFHERPVGEPQDFIVTPRVTVLPGSGLAVVSGDGASREALRNISPNADELIAREYRPGDPLRRVNWRATARHGELMVRQEEQRSNPEARLVLDTTPPGSNPRTTCAFELAIEVAASVGVHLIGAGFRMQLVELGPSQVAPGAEREHGGLRGDAPVFFDVGGERPLLEALSTVQPIAAAPATPDEAPLRQLGTGQSPTVAILVETDARGLADLRALRERSHPAIAFVLATVSPGSVVTLRDAGWRCILVNTAADIPEAWDSALRPGPDREGELDE
ncbi:DUF58 domain-containing protein [Cryobacterium melibiosiphilum]|uniref:DUF58 domain-containing protein n=1 Tax=Cryobacterium melibiosiphilum TaxID=995039 RepID=A0A3A5MDM6_9MICO|nr:DUF58 domain-containing protein [Cryobacterium melibiosiphilum]RJT84707.1 DUF58 domain-containing protein [Cryobacterium melibiosiphilum]